MYPAKNRGRTCQGIVLDEREEDLLPGATLTLRREGRLLERVEFSDHDGFFAFQGVPEGDYTLTIELAGFSSHEGRVRVRKGANLGQVLVGSLAAHFEGCGHLEMTSARRARQMQQEILGRRSRIHLEEWNEGGKSP